MAGTKREREPGVWELRFYVEDPLRGRWQRSVTFRGSERQASKELARLVTEAESHGAGSSAVTVSELIERWLALKGPSMSPLTVARYRIALRVHIGPALGRKQVRKLRTEDLDRFYSALVNKGMAPSSVLKIHGVLSASLRQAMKWGWIQRNPAELTHRPQATKWQLDLPPLPEVYRFLDRATEWSSEYGRLLWATLFIGARRGEMLGLQRRDVDYERQLVHLRRQIVHPPGEEPQERKVLKWNSTRAVAVSDGAIEVLREQADAMEKRAHDTGYRVRATSYLWSDDLDCGRPWKPNRVTRAFGRLIAADKEAGWPGIDLRFHDLRHLNATLLSDSDVDLATIGYRLGHSRLSTTADYYVQRVKESDRNAAGELDKRLVRRRS